MKTFKQYTSEEYKNAAEELSRKLQEIESKSKVDEFVHILDEDLLNEKLITFGGQAYPKNGQVLILAGGAGSGKGFTLSNLIGLEGKVFDVDNLKKLVINSKHIAKLVKQYSGVNVKKLNLRNPEDVKKLHYALDSPAFEYPKKEQKQLFDTLTTIAYSDDEHRPNLIFDVTLEKLSKFMTICTKVQDIGYKKENIHIVWILTDIKVAIEQNKGRDRVVPEDILIQTHEGASMTMKKLISDVDNLRKYMDGDIWISANVTGVDSALEKSKTSGGNAWQPKSSKGVGSYVSEANYFLVKKKGEAPKTVEQLANIIVGKTNLLSKIKQYTPKIDTW